MRWLSIPLAPLALAFAAGVALAPVAPEGAAWATWGVGLVGAAVLVSWWLEPSTGTIMCLAETDDPKGAVASHQETDGDLAEEMAEVTQGP